MRMCVSEGTVVFGVSSMACCMYTHEFACCPCCRNLDKAEPKYKSKAPLSYVAGTTKFYTEAIATSKIIITEGDAMQS